MMVVSAAVLIMAVHRRRETLAMRAIAT
jgi:hypothetical protein